MALEIPLDAYTSTSKVSKLNSKKAFVTFFSNDDYVKGVVGLVKSLRNVKSAYPLVVAILLDVPKEHREFLRSQDCIVRKIVPTHPLENQIQFAMAYYVINYSKLRVWNVTWPAELGSPPPLYFNAGMFVFEPSKLTYENLLQTLQITPPTPFAEQDFLNMFFEKVYKPIPLIYNLVLAMLCQHPDIQPGSSNAVSTPREC
ncbi:galactinol synthase 1-like [Olea europaea subsp. europaea]|uniref:Hexosyltransferase n=1 Tax=Olea europaea subsp. europaea TaxID=158383 RepID=A0A8S0Q4E9_OLEEU|nr:galactinol synthase 1-like [Olea europaea subsp. europaea]